MRVLLIEDDRTTAQSIELMLKSESFNVYTTDLGEEGIDLGKVYDYDIILPVRTAIPSATPTMIIISVVPAGKRGLCTSPLGRLEG
jgi:hypothetical protein